MMQYVQNAARGLVDTTLEGFPKVPVQADLVSAIDNA